jgi:hypothetical protein
MNNWGVSSNSPLPQDMKDIRCRFNPVIIKNTPRALKKSQTDRNDAR